MLSRTFSEHGRPVHLKSLQLALKELLLDLYSHYSCKALVMLAAEIIALSSVLSPYCHLERRLEPHLCIVNVSSHRLRPMPSSFMCAGCSLCDLGQLGKHLRETCFYTPLLELKKPTAETYLD